MSNHERVDILPPRLFLVYDIVACQSIARLLLCSDILEHLATLSSMFFKTFYCFPLVKDLNHGDADGQSRVFDPSDQCTGGSVAQYTRTAYLLTTSLLDIIDDLICLILPFCILRNLHISLRKKIALGVINRNAFELTSRFSLPLLCLASFVAVSVSRSESREERNFKWRHGEWSKRQPRYALRPHQPFALYSSARRILCVEHPT